MTINYCDLCGTPLKDYNFYMLYVSEPRNTNYDEMKDYYANVKKVQDNAKEICPTCKHIFDKMFELRLQRLSELTEELNCIYKVPTKDKKNGKKEK